MKKRLILLTCFCISVELVSAQLTVDINGNVGIGDTITSYNSKLSVNGAGISTAMVYAQTKDRSYGIYSENYTTNTAWTFAYYGRSKVAARKHVGIYGLANSDTILYTGRTIGVLGYAANATSGYNYGIFGGLGGSQNGGAVVGSVYQPWGLSNSITGRYAGYFEGPVLATDAVTALEFLTPSDATAATNVSNLDSERSYQGIMSLTPVEYQSVFEMNLEPEVSDTISSETLATLEKLNEEKNASSRTHFGLLAEEVKKYYPELVHETSNGELSIDYIGMIPLLIQTVQQLDAEVKSLRAEEISKDMGYGTESTESARATQKQDILVAANGSCEIEYTLPEDSKTARLFIYNISGSLAASYELDARADGKLSIDTSKMNKGIYIYTMIADGQSIGSRQMIVQ